jgi:putative hemolysin
LILVEIAVVFVLMLVNGVLAMSELALMSARRARLEQMAQAGSRGAAAALRLLDDPTAFLSTVQVGITLVGILAGALSGATLGIHLADFLAQLGLRRQTADTLGIGGVVLVLTYVSLVIGELVPKRLALAFPERAASLIAVPLAFVARIGLPLVWVLRVSTNAVLRLLGVGERPEARVTEEEIRALLAEGAQAGVVKPIEHELIEGVMRIADRPVRAIMTPRVDLVWLDVAASRESLRTLVTERSHSRYPVARGGLDDLVGIVHVRDIMAGLLGSGPFDLAALARPAVMVHESTAVVRIVELFRKGPERLAVVLDEYGVVEGVVAPADVLSAIAGELSQGADEEPDAVRRADGSWLVDGRLEIHRLERLLDRHNLDRGGRYQTVAGLVLWELGRMPHVGDTFRVGNLRFEVVDLDRRRIDKVLIAPVDL